MNSIEDILFPPDQESEQEGGISGRRIDPSKIKINYLGPEPAHYSARLLPELLVLVELREQFRDIDPEKFAKCRDAIWNFKTQAVNWDDFV